MVWRGGPVPKKPWEPWEDAKLRQDWYRSVSTDIIAEELKRSPSDVRRRRIKLGLEPRRFLVARTKISLQVSAEMARAVGRRARERGQTVSEYLRSLIKRDLG